MTDQPTGPNPGDPGYTAAAAQAVGQVQQPGQGVDAGDTVQAMQDQAVRAAMTDYEEKLKAMMAAAEQQQAQWSSQFAAMSRQLASVRAQAGPPVATLLADSLAQRVKSIAIANPELGGQHFAGVVSQAESLAEEVKAVAGGQGDAGRAEQLANGVQQFFTRIHLRASGKVLEGMHAALDEAERIIEELPNLVPVAAAVASVL